MEGMFGGAISFDQSLEKWNVSNVEGMMDMFAGAKLEKTNNLPSWYKKFKNALFNECF
jgi:hypothetical protein